MSETPAPEIGNWEGATFRDCHEHRTTGRRAWCFDCAEWCYQSTLCHGCAAPKARSIITELRKLIETLTVGVNQLEELL